MARFTQNTHPNLIRAALIDDDVDSMSEIERTLNRRSGGQIGGPAFKRPTDRLSASRGPEATFSSVLSGLFKSLPQGGEATRQGIRAQFADAIGSPEMSADAMRRYQRAQSDAFLSTPEFESDTARGVFQGKIIVERGADGTDARMGHHALILGERAEIDAKPELEIYADDVQCAHGNTVGNLDESALFYMQQRGIPADEARALLTQAFLIEVVDRIGHEGAREVVREWLTARL